MGVFTDENLGTVAVSVNGAPAQPITGMVSLDATNSLFSAPVALAHGLNTVTVTATANDGSGVSGTMNVEVTDKPNGVSNTNLDPVRVGPNPVTNGTLMIEGATKVKEIELISMLGETMLKLKNYNQPAVNITLNLNPGIYLVRLNDGVSSIYKKIIVK